MHVGRGEVGPVLIAWADASAPDLPDARVLRRLGDEQVRRHAQLDDARARRFLVARWLIEDVARALSGLSDVHLTSRCERCGGDHGRPRVVGAPVAVSVSYAGSMVAVAAVELALADEIGVDIEGEAIGEDARRMAELAPLFAPAPPPDLRGWTLIEAALKADGRGLRVPPDQVRLGERADRMLAGAYAVSIPGQAYDIEATEAIGPQGFLISVAVATTRSA